MKIHELEQIKSQLLEKKKAPQGKGEEFKNLLEKELGLESTKRENPTSPGKAPAISQLSELEVSIKLEKTALNATSLHKSTGNVMDKIEKTLSKWEKYSHSLQNNNLKESYGILQDIMEDISVLEKNATEQQQEDRSVFSIVNELKILATTEKARFSRGDYLL